MTPLILEAALRTAAMAAIAWTGLRLLRVGHVAARKLVWTVVLLAGVAMPVLLRWHALPLRPSVVLPSAVASSVALPLPPVTPPVVSSAAQARRRVLNATPPRTHAPAAPPPLTRLRTLFLRSYLPAYLTISLVLMLRLLLSLALAADIWRRARPVPIAGAPPRRVRVSAEIAGPVTVASSIVLPSSFAAWDAAKLRIVLAHEAAHVRQGDFYLQVLARLHTAVFWFSPVAWWLQRELADLGEAISDRAALDQAADPPAYAEVLLQFAATPRPAAGVAMARSTRNLQQRIDRLLNDRLFRSAFMQGRKHLSLAAVILPVALVLSTSLVRVRAAQQVNPGGQAAHSEAAPSTPAPPLRTAPAPSTAPALSAKARLLARPTAAPASAAEIGQAAPPAPPPAASPQAPASPASAPPASPDEPGTPASPDAAPPDDALPAVTPLTGQPPALAGQQSFTLITGGQSHSVYFNGYNEDLASSTTKVHGDAILFERQGRPYLIDDPALVRQAQQMMQPIEDLGRQQQALGAQQQALGKRQEELSRQQRQTTLPTPDMSQEIAELQTAMQRLQQLQKSQSLRQEDLAGVQGQLGGLQGRLGALEGRLGAQAGMLGAQQGALGAEQGRLGAQQGRLGAQQARLSQEVSRRMKTLIDQAVREGKAQPLQ